MTKLNPYFLTQKILHRSVGYPTSDFEKKCPKTPLDFGVIFLEKCQTSPQYGTPYDDFEKPQLPAHLGPPNDRKYPKKSILGSQKDDFRVFSDPKCRKAKKLRNF